MAHVLKFVDDVDSAATVRLDLNAANGVLRVREVQWNPARLLRSVSQNVLRDGGYVGPSSYDLRSLGVSLFLVAADFDEAADYIQDLARELDRETNWLMYQPDGATNPVFFKTYRSDISALQELLVKPRPLQQIDIELLTDPHALGEMVTLGPYTIAFDPAAATNPCFYDLTGIKGDVDAPLMVQATLVTAGNEPTLQWLSTTRTQLLTTKFIQAESMTLGTNTTNPGGGPDSAMSGTGTNNYVRTSFGTATMATRVSTLAAPALPGRYRVLAMVRQTDGSTVINMKLSSDLAANAETVRIATGTQRQVVDLGIVDVSSPQVGYSDTTNATPASTTIGFQAERVSGTGSLDWDFIYWVPADEQLGIFSGGDAGGHLIDGVNEVFNGYATGDPVAGTATGFGFYATNASGSYPYVSPGVTNRVTAISSREDAVTTVTATRDYTFYYWPRYTMIRTATT